MFNGKEYAYEVYKEKGFSAAAKKLYITQPALSNTIKRIEKKIGLPIFDRSVSPIQLTTAGKAYIDAVEQIMDIEKNFLQYLDDEKNMKNGEIHIGCNSMFMSYVMPQLIASYKKHYPLIHLNMIEINADKGSQKLSDGSLDLLFEHESLPENHFKKTHFKTEHMLLAVPKKFSVNHLLETFQQNYDHIISDTFLDDIYPEVPLKQMSGVPFILSNKENSYFQDIINGCKKSGFSPEGILFVNQELTAYNMTCAGIGASFVSDTLIKHAGNHPDVVFYKFDCNYFRRDIWIYTKKNKYAPRCIQTFLDHIFDCKTDYKTL